MRWASKKVALRARRIERRWSACVLVLIRPLTAPLLLTSNAMRCTITTYTSAKSQTICVRRCTMVNVRCTCGRAVVRSWICAAALEGFQVAWTTQVAYTARLRLHFQPHSSWMPAAHASVYSRFRAHTHTIGYWNSKKCRIFFELKFLLSRISNIFFSVIKILKLRIIPSWN